MLRLVAYAQDGVSRFPLHREELVIGSQDGCDIQLPYSGVAQRHALLRLDGRQLSIRDLGSRRGMLVNGRRVREAALDLLDEVRLGSVTLLVEDAAAAWSGPPAKLAAPPPAPCIDPERMLEHLARVSDWVLGDAESQTHVESLISDLVADFGGGALFLFLGDAENPAIKLVVASDGAWLAGGEELVAQVRRFEAGGEGNGSGWFEGRLDEEPAGVFYSVVPALERPYLLIAAFPQVRPGAFSWSPAGSLRSVGNLLVMGLVHHVGRYEPILPGQGGRAELRLAPGLIVGESAAMRAVLDQLRAAIDPPIRVLLVGEPGSGRELLARTLHLSGRRSSGPFVTASCAGASPSQIEADLFGAEVPGRGGPIRRDGKLVAAHGGTLFLRDVEALTLELQARLMRFLREGRVEPRGGSSVHQVEVRIITASHERLERLATAGEFRVDLAHRLSEVTIPVPPLRERREELPLLIQSCVNRICHEVGKRVQGITVKALSTLVGYDYPGNLNELENVTRQLVHLCSPGQPIDLNLLPETVKLGKIRAAGAVDSRTDLDLGRLVASCEQAAIREALRRTHGNKSQAARLLGLSRNGLAMKMGRYRI